MSYQIKSNYIKNIISGVSYSNTEIVEKVKLLCRLENYIINPPKGYSSGMLFSDLKCEFNEEYLALLKELDLNKYNEELELIEVEKNISDEKKSDETFNDLYWWKENGGKEVE